MSGYIKYFENGRKNTSFVIKDDMCLDKYNEIWDKIKGKLYIKTKLTESDGVIKTKFLGDEIPKEDRYCTCIASITIDFVMRMEKKNCPQVSLEECKYKIKKKKMTKFINTELQSESESEFNVQLELWSESEPGTE